MVRDPVKPVGRQRICIEFTVSVLNGSNLILETELEFTYRVEQSRRQTPHLIHSCRTGIVELRLGELTVAIQIIQCLFGTEVLYIAAE